jgi:hypothetical protein
MPALTSLNISYCGKVTDETLRAVSNLPAIASLNLIFCRNVTAAGVQALRDTTAAPNLVIKWEETSDVVSTEGSTEGSTDDLEDWE